MSNAIDSPSWSLDSHELRCLSVVRPMTFMMAIEYDMFLCATHVGSGSFTLSFPTVAPTFRKLLFFCAARFQLTATGAAGGDADADAEAAGPITVSGSARLPLLRYVDFLPGNFHLDEILSIAHVKLANTNPKQAAGAQKNAFEASAIDYGAYGADEPTFDASSFFFTIEQGLPLATMGHLLRFEVVQRATTADAIKSFQRFSGWKRFDLRWDDETEKRCGVVAFPGIADVHDIFEHYEDEESDDDCATLLFRIRPVAQCAHVPYLEDVLVRRLRQQHWAKVLELWEASPAVKATVVVQSIAQPTPIAELLVPFRNVAEATLVMDDTPHKRRRLFITFKDPEAARDALNLDFQRIQTLPGRPAFRIQVAPPYMSATRRGNVLSTFNPAAPDEGSVSPQATSISPPPEDAPPPLGGASKLNTNAPAFIPLSSLTNAPAFVPASSLTSVPNSSLTNNSLTSAPPPYVPSARSPQMGAAQPPPYGMPPPPPSYNIASRSPPVHFAASPPLPPAMPHAGESPQMAPQRPPPQYATPPQYASAPPPAYNKTPTTSPQSAPLPPPYSQ
jgi:hypothetical protein